MNKWRFIIFICFCAIIPCGYLIVRYNLFQPTQTYQVGIWGVLVLSILIGTLGVLISYYLESMKTKYSLFKQIVNGLIKVILPMILLLVIVIFLGNNITKFKEMLIVLIVCETIAIIINPLPKWCFDNNIEGLGNIIEKLGLGKEEKK